MGTQLRSITFEPESSLARGSTEEPWKTYISERLFSLSPSDNQLATLIKFIVRGIASYTGSLRGNPVFLHTLLALSYQIKNQLVRCLDLQKERISSP